MEKSAAERAEAEAGLELLKYPPATLGVVYRHRAQEKSGRGMATDERRSAAIREYQKALVQAKEVETSFKKRALLDSLATVRERVPSARSTYRPPPRPLLSASLPCHVPGRTSRLLARARCPQCGRTVRTLTRSTTKQRTI